jgi:DNA-binding IclR family transcriptional regulator
MHYSLAERRSTKRNTNVALSSTPSRRAEAGRLSSVATSVRLLKAFSEEQVEIGISDLARRLGIAKSTVHRLAVTLVADGMLEQNPDTGKYRLGIALFRLGSLVRRRMIMSNEARPLLRELREKVNETVHLAVLDGSEIMYVFNLESTQAIRMRSDVGVRKPAYCTAEGQAILAFQPSEVIERVVGDGLAPRTPQTITDPNKLRKVLDGVRVRGCAIEDEESELGMRCIAAPLRNDAGEVVAAIGLAGPVSRLSKKALATFIPHVIETAIAISARLGYRGRMDR